MKRGPGVSAEVPGPREAETEARAINLAMDVRKAASDEEALELVKREKGIWDEIIDRQRGGDIALEAIQAARAAADDTEAARILRDKLSGLHGSLWERILDLQDERKQGEE